jgi:prolyl oligopeptidase
VPIIRQDLEDDSKEVTEFGTVKDPALFQAMHSYSPYQHVQPGVKYPAVLFMTGDNDRRVNPAQSRKITAELQAATASGLPVMLRLPTSWGESLAGQLVKYVASCAKTPPFSETHNDAQREAILSPFNRFMSLFPP